MTSSVAEVKVDDQDSVRGDNCVPSMVAERGQADDVKSATVEPVARPRLRLVQPVPQKAKKQRRATGSTRSRKTRVEPVPRARNIRTANDLHPPTIPGHRWKPSGLAGWELWTRRPATSKNGKRSSKGNYLAYYSSEAVRRLHAAAETTTNARRA